MTLEDEENARNRTRKLGLPVLLIFLILSIISKAYTSWEPQEDDYASCNRSRQILENSLWGFITDGPSNYTHDSHCEWLIKAPIGQYITLRVNKVRTECSYDYLFIFDGDSYLKNTSLLASMSGGAHPSNVTFIARSGNMLILLYSDTNYALEGFTAEYHISPCPLNCSNSGSCVSNPEGNLAHCECSEGRKGEGCHLVEGGKELTVESQLIGNYALSPSESIELIGHSAVEIEGQVFIFGGFNLNVYLSSLKIISFNPVQVKKILTRDSLKIITRSDEENQDITNEGDLAPIDKTSFKKQDLSHVWPEGRYGHASAPYRQGFFIHGGKSAKKISNHLYYFNATRLTWTRFKNSSLPHLMYHSMTMVPSGHIYVYGGGTSSGDFSSKLYVFSGDSPSNWTEVVSHCCGKPQHRAILGHTMSYWEKKNSLLIFGGLGPDNGRFSRLSHQMWLFNLESLTWFQVDYPRNNAIMAEGSARAFHTAHIFHEYLWIVGGYTHIHNKDESCYSSHLLSYNLECQVFLHESDLSQGVFGHQSILRGDEIFIFGGYRGFLSSRVEKVKVWTCKSHAERWDCASDPSCGWCPADEKCYEKIPGSKSCTTNLQSAPCAGMCPLMTSCQTCVSISPSSSCFWCEQLNKCIGSTEFQNACSSGALKRNYSECVTNTKGQRGVTLFEYKHPFNFSNPDLVLRVNGTVIHLPRDLSSLESGPSTFALKGFIKGASHPHKLELCATKAETNFSMRDSINTLESIGEEIHEQIRWSDTQTCLNLTWPTGVQVMISPDSKFIFEMSAVNKETPITGIEQPQKGGSFVSLHQQFMQTVRAILQPNLLPYLTDGKKCSTETNCLACVGDSACLWSENKCKSRFSLGENHLNSSTEAVIESRDCVVCNDMSSCTECLQRDECEWWEEEITCARRGRIPTATRDKGLCPPDCHLRTNCSSCLTMAGKCVWCEEKRECFVFSVYTSFYQYGQCVQWIDKPQQCQRCEKQPSCNECIKNLGCGWSYDDTGGFCTEGDFSGSYLEIEELLKQSNALSPEKTNRTWAYADCPDVNECELNITKLCHENATCVNTPGSYKCLCQQGFTGDGRDSCEKTCWEPCVHGTCSSDYICECNLGWTGVDCSIDCGCNNHSSCETGICDECQERTMGEHCQICTSGSFGDATDSKIGCNQCNCNGHGDESFGLCDSTTGICFCLNNTIGPLCSECMEGYYGDPIDGRPCYRKCGGRVLEQISGSPKGYFGSQIPFSKDPKALQHCLWAISAPKDGDKRHILIHIEPGFQVPCSQNVINIYSGFPTFGRGRDPQLVASVCLQGGTCNGGGSCNDGGNCNSGIEEEEDGRGVFVVVEGDLAVILLQNVSPRAFGFNASFQVVPGSPMGHRVDTSTSFHPLKVSKLYEGNSVHSRFGHSLHVDEWNVWIYGGYSLSLGPLDDIRQFSRTMAKWVPVTITVDDHRNSSQSVAAPPARYFHAGVLGQNGLIFIHGGISQSGSFMSDTWKFDTRGSRWRRLQQNGPVLAGHTLNIRGNEELIIIGGFNPQTGFSNSIWVLNLKEDGGWSERNTTGASPIGIYGHSSAFHKKTDSLYVFGGILHEVNCVDVSGKLFSLHWPSKRWSVLPPTEDNQILKLPSRRLFHSSVTSDEYMVIVGGGRSPSLLAYSYACNLWSTLGDIRELNLRGGASSLWGNELLFQGGWSKGRTIESLWKIPLPRDICSIQTSSEGCKATLGCSYCSSNNNHSQQCYTSDLEMPSQCSEGASNINFWKGTVCNKEWMDARNCNTYNSCFECLASWPSFPSSKPACQWCINCQVGRCVSAGKNCAEDIPNSPCNIAQTRNISDGDASHCQERVCPASECEKCTTLGKCIWTRQVLRTNDWSTKVHSQPVYAWNCVRMSILDNVSFTVVSTPPAECPKPCSSFTNCEECLGSPGSEGLFHECQWSTLLGKCISPAHKWLLCFGGVCGLVLKGGDPGICPKPCTVYKSCSTCLEIPSCGWCGKEGSNGEGICSLGDSIGSEERNDTNCAPLNWNYLTCPEENECTNGHHTCDPDSEVCIDLSEGFRCECREGYEREGESCTPICNQGCEHGTCVAPNNCTCHFGFVGTNCTHECQCNGHSMCAGIDQLDVCLNCQNNTMGPNCSQCKPMFVGNASNSGTCVSCSEYCNGHSDVCLEEKHYNKWCNNSGSLDETFLRKIQLDVKTGPVNDAFCCGCKNYTTGEKCHSCHPGFFRGTEDKRLSCRKCECHGHGDSCDSTFGHNCECNNNTESEHCTVSSGKCWKVQCAKCREYFFGTPTHGHQCYRQMFVETDYCFDPKSQESCTMKPKPLLSGKTVFFAVQPKFMNVNIRIHLDVTHGAVNVYLSPKEDTFVIKQDDKTSWMHHISFDQKYSIGEGNPYKEEKSDPKFNNISIDEESNGLLNMKSNLNTKLLLIEEEAAGFATHVTVVDPKTVLLVKNLRNRLVVTLPQDNHDLRLTRFYVVLVGVGDVSQGSVFFRQDQLHIDLFVFFSVFFSAFFLFLAACGIAWKVKQNMDVVRARHRHVAEMMSMAKRPFALWTIILEPEHTSPLYEVYNQCRKTCRKGCICIRPLAIEVTSEGSAAVYTMVVSLPGASVAPLSLCLASTLASSRSHPPLHMRRRRN